MISKKDVLKRGGANSDVSLCLLVYGYLWENAPSFLFKDQVQLSYVCKEFRSENR